MFLINVHFSITNCPKINKYNFIFKIKLAYISLVGNKYICLQTSISFWKFKHCKKCVTTNFYAEREDNRKPRFKTITCQEALLKVNE